MSTYTDKFDTICGNCAGIDILTITPADVRAQGEIYHATDVDIDDAIRGLEEYQEDKRARSKAAAALGSRKSPAKSAAARANGAKGGRPRKVKNPPTE